MPTIIEITILPGKGFVWSNNHSDKQREFRFGMSQEEVEALWNPPARYTVDNLIHMVKEPRSGTTFNYDIQEDKSTSLCSIDIPIQQSLRPIYKGIDIFNGSTADVVAGLSAFDTPTPDNGKYMNFYKLGLSLGGFGRKQIPEKKLVTLFPPEKRKYMEMMFKIGGGKPE